LQLDTALLQALILEKRAEKNGFDRAFFWTTMCIFWKITPSEIVGRPALTRAVEPSRVVAFSLGGDGGSGLLEQKRARGYAATQQQPRWRALAKRWRFSASPQTELRTE